MIRRPTAMRAAICLALLVVSAAATARETYTVDPARSDIHWRIYRAGPLAEKGHNHVISARRFSGAVTLVRGGPSTFELAIPVTALEVDNPALRRRYGPGFDTGLTEADRAATRANMLGPSLLDSARHAQIRLTGSATLDPGTAGTQVLLPVAVSIAGRTVRLRLPATISVSGRELRARGSFSLSHRQLGLRPFTAALGALRVAERIDFSFDIRASLGR